MESKRLSKALAAAGIASRRACEEIIFAGRVKVNGKTILEPQYKVSWDSDHITVDEKQVAQEEKKVYYLLNKPKGYLCTNVRPGKKKIVIDLFEGTDRLFTIGRLDKDTTGLLIVTNDGIFAQKIIHPSKNIEKEYIGKATREIMAEDLETLSNGVNIDGAWIRPVRVAKVRKGTFKIIVKEGKKHEIRIMAEKAGLKLIELKRVRIGTLTLGTLTTGSYRSLTVTERERMLKREVNTASKKSPSKASSYSK